ncbi:MAG: hypothetical protein ACLP0B_09470, partial [Steroidobacteraceae bacterium]
HRAPIVPLRAAAIYGSLVESRKFSGVNVSTILTYLAGTVLNRYAAFLSPIDLPFRASPRVGPGRLRVMTRNPPLISCRSTRISTWRTPAPRDQFV